MSFGKYLHDIATSFREDRIEDDAQQFVNFALPDKKMIEKEEQVSRLTGAGFATIVAATLISILQKESTGQNMDVAQLYTLGLGSMASYRFLRYSDRVRDILGQSSKA